MNIYTGYTDYGEASMDNEILRGDKEVVWSNKTLIIR